MRGALTQRLARVGILAGLTWLTSVPAAAAPSALPGTWRSDQQTDGVVPGTLQFGPGTQVTLAPDGLLALHGTYRATAQLIDIQTPTQGRARLGYWLTNRQQVLHLQYENGRQQRFQRLPAGGAARP